ncbi:MAG: DUF3800 domain-containing protein [Caldisericia bacterium]|nr:DUF3800 domain-containing protein [Caldisericia bacterium]
MLVNLAQQNKGNRNTIYLDESGVSSLKDKKRFFILTGVIANNSEFQALSEYYFRLKYKYFNEDKTIHSKDIFWKSDKKEQLFITELVEYLDTLNFSFIVVIVDKEEILKNTPQTYPKNPFYTTFSQAKSIWQRTGLATETFKDKTIDEVLEVVKKTKFPDINNQYPLMISYKTILKEYINTYIKKLKIENPEFEICFETSPNRERIIRYTEDFFEEKKTGSPKEKTAFAKKLKDSVYSISFPNKKARYLGLEIADIISYGYNLSKYKKINFSGVESYKDVWGIICKKKNILKRDFGIDCEYRIPHK